MGQRDRCQVVIETIEHGSVYDQCIRENTGGYIKNGASGRVNTQLK